MTSFTIAPAATATAITSSANPAVYGQPITYTATVTNTSGTTPTPAPVPVGSVQFDVDGGVNSGGQTVTVPLNASGQAVLPDTFLSGASHTVQATYDTKHQLRPTTPTSQTATFVDPGRAVVRPSARPVKRRPHGPVHWQHGATHATTRSRSSRSATATPAAPVSTSRPGSTASTPRPRTARSSPINVFLQNGNDNVTMASTLTINAIVTAGNGNDTVQLGGGNNTVTVGNGGNDSVTAGSGNNTVTVGNGNDSVTAGNGNNTVTLGNGNDTVQLGAGSNVVVEGNGNDSVTAGNGNNLIVAGLGHDTIKVGNGTNILIAGSARVKRSILETRSAEILNTGPRTRTRSNQGMIRQRFTVNYNRRTPAL